MTAGRQALVVAVDDYVDPGFSRLRAPAHDADALAEILGDPKVGDFAVTVLRNADAQRIRLAVEDFFADRAPEDLLLLHFSCHGVKSASGELFLAAADSRPSRLASTAVAADFVNRQMADCRAQRIALFLDCCYGGAFPRGMVMRGTSDVSVLDTFASQEQAGGRGRVVVTASSAVEYAFEGGELAGDADVAPSVFTGSVVEGLTSGEADRDGDGWVGLNELFGFVAERVRRATPNQTPHLWAFGSEGDLRIARSRRRTVVATPLPAELAEAVRAPLAATRFGVAAELRDRLTGGDLGQALSAFQALSELIADDSRRVSELASDAVAGVGPTVSPAEVVLDAVDRTTPVVLLLGGPPLARAATVGASPDWVTAEVVEDRVEVLAPTQPPDDATASLTLTTPTGTVTVPVRVGRPGEAAPVAVRPDAARAPAADPTTSETSAVAAGSGPVSRLQRVVAVAVAVGVVLLALGYSQISPYLRMPSGFSDIERAAPVDGYSTGLLCLVGGALALWLRPRAATAGGLVVGVAGWLVLLAATQLGQPAVTSGTSEQLGWGATIYLGIGVAAVGVLALAQQGLLRGPLRGRKAPRVEGLLVLAGAVLMLLSLAAPFNGKPAILHQSGLGILVALTASVLVLLVSLTELGPSRGDALFGAAVGVLLLDFTLLLLLALNSGGTFTVPAIVGTLLLAAGLVLRRNGVAPG